MAFLLAVETRRFGDLIGWSLIGSLPAILVVAFLANRLLGVRRSVLGTVMAGVVGWLTGSGLAVVIARKNADAGGFTRNIWLFSIVFTMSASVWVELLAKPGALGRVRAGFTVPHPIRALRARFRRVGRYAEISRIAVRHGIAPFIGMGSADEGDGRPPPAQRLRRALED